MYTITISTPVSDQHKGESHKVQQNRRFQFARKRKTSSVTSWFIMFHLLRALTVKTVPFCSFLNTWSNLKSSLICCTLFPEPKLNERVSTIKKNEQLYESDVPSQQPLIQDQPKLHTLYITRRRINQFQAQSSSLVLASSSSSSSSSPASAS